jgi:hypothetical protein
MKKKAVTPVAAFQLLGGGKEMGNNAIVVKIAG